MLQKYTSRECSSMGSKSENTGVNKSICARRIRNEVQRISTVNIATVPWKIIHKVGKADSQSTYVQVRLNKENRILVECSPALFSLLKTRTNPDNLLLRIVLIFRKYLAHS